LSRASTPSTCTRGYVFAYDEQQYTVRSCILRIGRQPTEDRELTWFNLQLHGATFKKKAPKAIKEIKDFATKAMGTTDVRLDPELNKKVWEQGVKGVPYRLRVRISRRRNDEEGAKEKLYSYVQAVNVKNPKGLHTVVVEE
jgi:large subunit ribosomal protein L31e